jgi:hypothetical protein
VRISSTVWIWQHDKRTDDIDNKIILKCVRKLMKTKNERKRAGQSPKVKKTA